MVLDASVWVAAFITQDPHQTDSAKFLGRFVLDRRTAHAPGLLLAEVAGAVARQMRDTAKAENALKFIRTQSWLSIHTISESQAGAAAAVAASQFLRGADAIYVALARQLGVPMVTWDLEIVARAAAVVPALTPSDWLRQNPVAPD